MFNLGLTEILLILAIALVVVGPKRLPELARSLGKGMRELRKATDDLSQSIRVEVDDAPTTSLDPEQATAAEPAAETAAQSANAPPTEPALDDDAPEGAIPRDGAPMAAAEPEAPQETSEPETPAAPAQHEQPSS